MADASRGAIWEDPEVRRALDDLPEPFAALDRTGRVVFVNRTLAAERPGKRLVGRRARAVWPLLAGSEVAAAFERAYATGVPARFEHRIGDSDRWLEFSAYRSGEFLLVHARDLTGAKRAARRQGALQAIVDALPHVAWHAQPDGQVVINDRWRAYTGSEGAGIEDFWAHLHPDDLPIAARALAGRAKGEPYE